MSLITEITKGLNALSISFYFYLYLILHACVVRFDVMGNLVKFGFFVHLVKPNCVEFLAVRSRNAGKMLFLVPCICGTGSIGSSAMPMPFMPTLLPFMNRCKRNWRFILHNTILLLYSEWEWARIHDSIESLPLVWNGPPESLRYPTVIPGRIDYMGAGRAVREPIYIKHIPTRR